MGSGGEAIAVARSTRSRVSAVVPGRRGDAGRGGPLLPRAADWSTACARRAARCCCSARSRSCSTCRSPTAASRRTVRAACWASGWAGSPPPSSAASAPRWRATTTMVVALLLVTDVSTREVAVVLAWAGKHALRGLVAGARGSWRVMRAAFPEKDDRDDRQARREPEADDVEATPIPSRSRSTPAMADAHDEPEDVVEPARGRAAGELEAVPEPMAAQESEGVRVGEAHGPGRREGRRSRARRDGGDRRRGRGRRALRARGVRRRRGAGGEDRRDAGDRSAAAAAAARRGRADHRRARVDRALPPAGSRRRGRRRRAQRRGRRAPAGREAGLHQAGRRRLPACRAPICSSTSRPPTRTPTSSRSTTWPSGSSRRCRTTACAAR